MRGGFDPDRDLPSGLAEADLLAFVEADAGQISAAASTSVLGRVEAARRADPRLASLLDAMRVDRAALGSLDTPAPSESVAIAVLEEHERQALLALSDTASRGPRTSQSDEDEAFSFSAMPRWFKPALAVAAVLALAFGAWQLVPFITPKQPTPGPDVAINDQDASDAVEVPTQSAEPIVIAAEDTQPIGPPPQPLLPSSADVLAARLDMPARDAIELARAGRLLIVVDVRRATEAVEAAARIGAQPIDSTWCLRDAESELVAALSTPAQARLVGIEDAGDDLLTTARGPLGQIEVVMAAAPTVSMAEASASPEALLSLLDGLAYLGDGIRVVPLDEPLPGAGVIDPTAAGFDVLWWTQDPATWQPRTAIPVRFIESR